MVGVAGIAACQACDGSFGEDGVIDDDVVEFCVVAVMAGAGIDGVTEGEGASVGEGADGGGNFAFELSVNIGRRSLTSASWTAPR